VAALATTGFGPAAVGGVAPTGFVLAAAGGPATTGFVLAAAGGPATTGFVLATTGGVAMIGFVLAAGDGLAPIGFVTAATSGFALVESGADGGALTGFDGCSDAPGFCASGGVEVGFACAAAAANFAASTDGSGLLAATLGGFALGETANGSERTGGTELTGGAVGAGDLAACVGVDGGRDGAGVDGAGVDGAGVDDGRGGAGEEGPALGATLGVARGTRPEARRAARPPVDGGPEGRGVATLGAAGGRDDVGRGAAATGDGAAAAEEDSGFSDVGRVSAGWVRGNEPKMSSSSPQPESTFCSSLSGAAGAGVLPRGAAFGAAGDVSQAESSGSPSAVLMGGDSASFMSASDRENCRTNRAMVRRPGAL
jgi:hypothetical protein